MGMSRIGKVSGRRSLAFTLTQNRETEPRAAPPGEGWHAGAVLGREQERARSRRADSRSGTKGTWLMSVSARSDENPLLTAELRAALGARIAGPLVLPVLSTTATRVLALSQDEHSDLAELAELISSDQSLATHVLRAANSAGHAPLVPILSLQQALGRLGLATVGDIAVAVALRERVFSVPGHHERIRELWVHALATALYSREVAQLLRTDIGSTFLCGLLHDVGMPVVMQLVCDLESEKVVAAVPATGMEAAMLEFHCELGARIAEGWKLGPWIRLAVLHHHDPAGARFRPVEIPIVALADELAYWAFDRTRDERDFRVEASLVTALKLHEGALASLLGRRERVIRGVQALA